MFTDVIKYLNAHKINASLPDLLPGFVSSSRPGPVLGPSMTIERPSTVEVVRWTTFLIGLLLDGLDRVIVPGGVVDFFCDFGIDSARLFSSFSDFSCLSFSSFACAISNSSCCIATTLTNLSCLDLLIVFSFINGAVLFFADFDLLVEIGLFSLAVKSYFSASLN